jgi:hypothetical protein
MRTLDKTETIRWLSQNGVSFDSVGRLTSTTLFKAIHYPICPDSGQKTALSKLLVSFFEDDNEAILWINEFGIWPSSEDWCLFDGFRRSFGEDTPLYKKPGHLFSKGDLSIVRSLVAMILYFIWGAVLYSPSNGLLVEVSHDEFISVFVKDKKDVLSVSEKLKRYSEKV